MLNQMQRKQQKIKFSLLQRANLFYQLALYEQSGFSFDKAFSALQENNDALKNIYARIGAGIQKGQNIALLGAREGLFSFFDEQLISASIAAGSPEKTYRNLGQFYETKYKQWQKLKSQMMLPLIILVLALFIAPLPSFILGTLSAGQYLFVSLGSLVKITLLIYALSKLPFLLRRAGFSLFVDKFLLGIPIFGPLLIRKNNLLFIDALGLLFSAGVPILSALPMAVNTIKNEIIRKQYAHVVKDIEGGLTLSQALENNIYFQQHTLKALVNTGEASGSLEQMLEHIKGHEQGEIALQESTLFEWLPRIVYFLICIWMAYSIIAMGVSNIPKY